MLSSLTQQLNQAPKVVKAAIWTLLGLYGLIAVAPFVAPYSAHWSNRELAWLPPTPIYMRTAETGEWRTPFVIDYSKQFNPTSLSYRFNPNPEKMAPIHWFVEGEPYKLLGLFPTRLHLFGTKEGPGVHLLGTDANGRDLFSRLLIGGQVSLTVGFLALLVSLPLALSVGGIAGYAGGLVDTLLMRFAEIVMSIPSLFLLISLASLLPASLSSTERFALVTVILALIGWAGLARVIRGMVLSIRQQEFVEAARTIGSTRLRILFHHVLPQTVSYVIVAVTLGVPGYILAESGLSFLGLGIKQPDPSWGNLLKEAQDLVNLIERPWMLMPGLGIVLVVWAFNTLGDWVRDAWDPRKSLQT